VLKLYSHSLLFFASLLFVSIHTFVDTQGSCRFHQLHTTCVFEVSPDDFFLSQSFDHYV